MVEDVHPPRIKEVYTTAAKNSLKQGMAFKGCGWPDGSGRPSALSGLLQSEGVGSTILQALINTSADYGSIERFEF